MKKRIAIVLLLLCYISFFFGSSTYVLCLEGDGNASVELNHLDGVNPFSHDGREHPLTISSRGASTESNLHVSIQQSSGADFSTVIFSSHALSSWYHLADFDDTPLFIKYISTQDSTSRSAILLV